ncbi:Nucleoporin Nup159/Nup146 N-terminal domain-containing protein [Plasmodiophora brassicae]|uniref:Uncharacterized protein n=1 Tax=Plasmodiophora brassicae TaxID=37360 RepID=A0A0G4IMP3_PLABS|nr:hypothetical protein PBRA_005114 [Plasmodiophora brassicae]SPQ94564.1 unnamed protein product [Plasmodiophora brassicae]
MLRTARGARTQLGGAFADVHQRRPVKSGVAVSQTLGVAVAISPAAGRVVLIRVVDLLAGARDDSRTVDVLESFGAASQFQDLLDGKVGRLVVALGRDDVEIWHVEVSLDGQLAAICSNSAVFFIDLTGRSPVVKRDFSERIVDFAWSPAQSRLFATVLSNGSVIVGDPSSQRRYSVNAVSCSWLWDRLSLACGLADGSLAIVSSVNGSEQHRWPKVCSGPVEFVSAIDPHTILFASKAYAGLQMLHSNDDLFRCQPTAIDAWFTPPDDNCLVRCSAIADWDAVFLATSSSTEIAAFRIDRGADAGRLVEATDPDTGEPVLFECISDGAAGQLLGQAIDFSNAQGDKSRTPPRPALVILASDGCLDAVFVESVPPKALDYPELTCGVPRYEIVDAERFRPHDADGATLATTDASDHESEFESEFEEDDDVLRHRFNGALPPANSSSIPSHVVITSASAATVREELPRLKVDFTGADPATDIGRAFVKGLRVLSEQMESLAASASQASLIGNSDDVVSGTSIGGDELDDLLTSDSVALVGQVARLRDTLSDCWDVLQRARTEHDAREKYAVELRSMPLDAKSAAMRDRLRARVQEATDLVDELRVRLDDMRLQTSTRPLQLIYSTINSNADRINSISSDLAALEHRIARLRTASRASRSLAVVERESQSGTVAQRPFPIDLAGLRDRCRNAMRSRSFGIDGDVWEVPIDFSFPAVDDLSAPAAEALEPSPVRPRVTLPPLRVPTSTTVDIAPSDADASAIASIFAEAPPSFPSPSRPPAPSVTSTFQKSSAPIASSAAGQETTATPSPLQEQTSAATTKPSAPSAKAQPALFGESGSKPFSFPAGSGEAAFRPQGPATTSKPGVSPVAASSDVGGTMFQFQAKLPAAFSQPVGVSPSTSGTTPAPFSFGSSPQTASTSGRSSFSVGSSLQPASTAPPGGASAVPLFGARAKSPPRPVAPSAPAAPEATSPLPPSPASYTKSPPKSPAKPAVEAVARTPVSGPCLAPVSPLSLPSSPPPTTSTEETPTRMAPPPEGKALAPTTANAGTRAEEAAEETVATRPVETSPGNEETPAAKPSPTVRTLSPPESPPVASALAERQPPSPIALPSPSPRPPPEQAPPPLAPRSPSTSPVLVADEAREGAAIDDIDIDTEPATSPVTGPLPTLSFLSQSTGSPAPSFAISSSSPFAPGPSTTFGSAAAGTPSAPMFPVSSASPFAASQAAQAPPAAAPSPADRRAQADQSSLSMTSFGLGCSASASTTPVTNPFGGALPPSSTPSASSAQPSSSGLFAPAAPAFGQGFGGSSALSASLSSPSSAFGSSATSKPPGASSSVFGQKPTNVFGSSGTTSSPFGQAASPAPAFGRPSSLGSTGAPVFGQPSSLSAPPAFGQPSSLGAPPAFGQASALGSFGSQPATTPAFGQRSALGSTAAPFGSSSASSSFASLASGSTPFGAPGQQQQQQQQQQSSFTSFGSAQAPASNPTFSFNTSNFRTS